MAEHLLQAPSAECPEVPEAEPLPEVQEVGPCLVSQVASYLELEEPCLAVAASLPVVLLVKVLDLAGAARQVRRQNFVERNSWVVQSD